MSREDVEMIERAVEAFHRRDLRALAEITHEDFEFVSVLAAIDADEATHRGANGWASYVAAIDEAWAEWRVTDLQVFDADDDRLAALFPQQRPGGGRRGHLVPNPRRQAVADAVPCGAVGRPRSRGPGGVDVVCDLSHHPAGFESGVYEGLDGIRAWFREWHEAWDEFEWTLVELIEAGEHVDWHRTREQALDATGRTD